MDCFWRDDYINRIIHKASHRQASADFLPPPHGVPSISGSGGLFFLSGFYPFKYGWSRAQRGVREVGMLRMASELFR